MNNDQQINTRIIALILRVVVPMSVCLLLVGSGHISTPSQKIDEKQAVSAYLDGVYEFVSEISDFSEPVGKKEILDKTRWNGIWIFHDGYFSKTITKRKDLSLSATERGIDNDDYISTTGQFSIKSGSLTMTYPLSKSAITVAPDIMQYKIIGDELILTRNFIPNLHSNAKGYITTTLHRIKPPGST